MNELPDEPADEAADFRSKLIGAFKEILDVQLNEDDISDPIRAIGLAFQIFGLLGLTAVLNGLNVSEIPFTKAAAATFVSLAVWLVATSITKGGRRRRTLYLNALAIWLVIDFVALMPASFIIYSSGTTHDVHLRFLIFTLFAGMAVHLFALAKARIATKLFLLIALFYTVASVSKFALELDPGTAKFLFPYR